MYIALIILALLAIPFVLALFASDEYIIERSITVDRSSPEVFSYLRILRNADHYNKWIMTDPGMKKEFLGTDGSIGFVYAWDSDNKQAGKGEQEITSIIEGKRLDYDIRFIKPWEGRANVSLLIDQVSGDQTKVSWIFSGKKNYMMKIMHMLLNLEKMLGRDMTTSLSNLKKIIEKR